jgi:trimeric autotransporter adhesin
MSAHPTDVHRTDAHPSRPGTSRAPSIPAPKGAFTMNTFPARTWSAGWRLLRSAGLALATGSLLLGATLAQAAPASGSVIGNQASATYTDASSTVQSATSNLVQTVVQQVGAFTLSGTAARTAAPGGTAYMAYTLTNTGNGTDTFTLQLTNNTPGSNAFDFSALAIYLDADGNGVPDTTTPLVSGTTLFTTPSVTAGSAYRFVVALSVPSGASNGNTDNVTVTAASTTTSLYAPTTEATKTGTSTVTVATGAAVFSVNKFISSTQGSSTAASVTCNASNTTNCVKVTYTLAYTNTGNAAGNLYLEDVIGSSGTAGTTNGSPYNTTGMVYVAGSARWNSNATALTDSSTSETLSGIAYQFGSNTIKAVIAGVQPGASGTLTFEVGILSAAAVGTATTSSAASFGTEGSTSVPATAPTTQATNVSAYRINATYGVSTNTSATNSGLGTSESDTTADNLIAWDTNAVAGSTLTFGAPSTTNNIVVWNTGNTTDTFNVRIEEQSTPFPDGRVITLYRADGVTPLADTNGDGTVDTGPLAAGANLPIVVKVVLPSNACITTTCGSSSTVKTVHVIATSVGSPTETNKAYVRLNAGRLTAPAASLISGTGDITSPTWTSGVAVTTNTVAGGSSTSFDLVVRNTSAPGAGTVAPSTSYELQYSSSDFTAPISSNLATAAANPATVPLPGWTVTFRAGACASNGAVITSTGSVAPGSYVNVCAVVTTTASSPAGTSSVYFRALSTSNYSWSSMRNAVTVTAVQGLSLMPNASGQLVAGGSVQYAHTLTNTGNVSCSVSGYTISQTLSGQGWTAVVYKDSDGNGQVNGSETLAGAETLAANSSIQLLVRVFAPGGAAIGAADVLTLVVTATCNAALVSPSPSVTDRTTVMSGQVRLVKRQVLDTACSGLPTSYVTTQVNAKPGECVTYEVVATNLGATSVTSVTISDATPSYTKLRGTTVPTCSSATTITPSTGSANYVGPVSCVFGTLAPGASFILVFSVQIDP